ncbi:MAG: AbrB/MazE/SpoVT family DNA-binding domain-containing protein [Polyangiaceae bacterium]|nr:AbrB/MazE/SpoVT family DNA-binding domain-containing protein [Polyangiaceae bacterium]
MSLVTPKLQVTLPKELADKYEILPGDEVEWAEADGGIRVIPAKTLPRMLSTQERLKLFDEATSRQRAREAEASQTAGGGTADRGWTREEIYDRGLAR